MRIYPSLLASDAHNDQNPKFKALISSLTGLYLVHHKSWALMRPFIAHGGLPALVSLLEHPILQVVSQALNILLLITDEELFPWHDPPLLPDGTGPKEGQGPDALAWAAMHQLSKTAFIKRLIRHATPSSFPEASHTVLKVVAFYLSWLRQHYTPRGVLHISKDLLDAFEHWAARALNKDDAMSCPPPSAEELQLASKLFDDFSRFPPAEADLDSPSISTTNEESIKSNSNSDNLELQSFLSESSDGKARADSAFREQRLDEAIDLYTKCLDMLVPSEALPSESKRRSVLHANRAASYLARVGMLIENNAAPSSRSDLRGLLEGLDLSSSDERELIITRHYEAALMDSQTSLDLDPSYYKAWARKALALFELGRHKEALDIARHGKSLGGISLGGISLGGISLGGISLGGISNDLDGLIDKITARSQTKNELEEMD